MLKCVPVVSLNVCCSTLACEPGVKLLIVYIENRSGWSDVFVVKVKDGGVCRVKKVHIRALGKGVVFAERETNAA